MARRGGRAAFAALVTAVALPAGAGAHAGFLESTPEPGTRLRASPPEVRLEFTEPLNRRLTNARIVAAVGGKRVPVAASVAGKQLTLRPERRLGRGAYRVLWHTVSTLDGHALEGSFSFGVGAAAAGGVHSLETSPLARGGWLRVAARALFYAILLFFAGGVLTALLLDRRRGPPMQWLVPEALGERLRHAGLESELRRGRAWRAVRVSGLLAAAVGVAVALVDTADAGSLTAGDVRAYLFSNAAGLARVAAIAAILFAAVVARLSPRLAGVGIAVAFLEIARSGHANSADQRTVAIASDAVHLLAASVWIGGIAVIVAVWAPVVARLSGDDRRAVMRSVLERFGRVALPAFAVVAASGLVNALVELHDPAALWQTSYGIVLAVKIALVGAIAAASYMHAIRLRPRLLAANPHASSRLERRHWRLLRSEPAIGLGVASAAALLVAFPLPPGQVPKPEADEGPPPAAPCRQCGVTLPGRQELAVADHAGSILVAAWLRPQGVGLAGRVRLMGQNLAPVRAVPDISPTTARRSCGAGCWTFRVNGHPQTLSVAVRERGRRYTAHLPARWSPRQEPRARRIFERALATMRRLRSFREGEDLTSGPGARVLTRYRLRAPDRMGYRLNNGAQSVVIGKWQWSREGSGRWKRDRFGGGGAPFRMRDWFFWSEYARTVRLLAQRSTAAGEVAELALMDARTPVWFRLVVDLRSMRVTDARMIADGHFMQLRYYAFDRPLEIRPPTR